MTDELSTKKRSLNAVVTHRFEKTSNLLNPEIKDYNFCTFIIWNKDVFAS